MNDMIGHNSAEFSLDDALSNLDKENKIARKMQGDHRDQMIILARALVAVDAACADNETFADSEIRRRIRILASDWIATANERYAARWLARGGMRRSGLSGGKNLNDIKDLATEVSNALENKLKSGKAFEKVTMYESVRKVVGRECQVEIRHALDGKGPDLDAVRAVYSDILFGAETVEGWIEIEQYKRTEDYQQWKLLSKAAAERRRIAERDADERKKLFDFYKKELAALTALAAQEAAEKAAKASAPRLTSDQRRRNADAFARGEADPVEEYDEK